MPSVFISHSSHDKPFVRTLVDDLKVRRVSTWVDERQIKVGQPIPTRIADGIRRCDFFIIVLSRAAIDSDWVERELNSAYFDAVMARNGHILPLRLENIELPVLLRSLKYADFTSSFDEGLKELLNALEINEEEIIFLSREERRIRIKQLIRTADVHGELPGAVLSFVEDESYLDLFETNLKMKLDRRVLRNSLYAIRYLAAAWDGRCIRRHHSIRPLLELYREADEAADAQIKHDVVAALCAIDSVSTKEFLITILRDGDRQLVSEILSSWQDMHEWEDISFWLPKILPLLHALTALPEDQCFFFEEDMGERDVRYWAFRCLQGLRRRSSQKYIEAALASLKYPMETLVEAAYAHWCVTRSDQYVSILRRAIRSSPLSNAKYFLEKIEKCNKSKHQIRQIEKITK